MDWFRVYHGMPTDPKWLLVARRAGHGVTTGHVVAIWCVLLDHASASKPRGNVQSVDLEAIAASLGWSEEIVSAAYDALVSRRHIVDGCIRTWDERNPSKFDATNAQRQKRHRQKAKAAEKSAHETAPRAPESNESNGRYGVTGNASRQVTPTEEKEQSKSSFSDSSKQDCNSTLKLDTPRTVREQAGAIVNAGDFWAWIAAQGIPAHIGIRTMNRAKLVSWIDQGMTAANLDEAMKRARKKRERQHSSHPVNIGFLACFIDEVLSGAHPTTTTGGDYERGDQLSREFADAG